MTGPGAPTPPASIEVFYSYAHEDEELVKELQKHLSILKWQGVIREWYDREITAGTDWKGQLDQHLNSSGIILLLVSADFLASKYCYDVEMRRALERHDQGEARVIPVLLRMVDGWQGAPFGKLQSLPTDGKPVTSWKICDEAFADVARGIRNAIGQLGVLQPPVGTTPVGQAFWNVPHPRNPSFTGREAEIAGLRERLARKRKTALAQAISGLGGIGKTQTAVEYAYRYRDEYKAVLWLNAESPLSLKTGCGDIARQMPLPHDEKDLDQAAAAVKDWLGTHPDWLLILDNADDPAVLEPFLPTDHEGHILITSRAQDFQHLGILDPVELGELPIEDATAFLLRRCGREAPTRQSEARHANWPASWTDCRSRWSRQRLTSWQPERHSSAISRVTARAAWPGSKRAGRPLGDTPSRSPPPGPPISRRCRRTPKPLPTSCGSVPSWLQTRSLSSY